MRISLIFGSLLALTLVALTAAGADLNWKGRYNLEGVLIKGAPLTGKTERSYMQHHLILEPKIVASDGVNIYGRFDILNNDYSDSLGYKGGEFFGKVGTAKGTSTETEAPETFEATLVYLAWIHEFGSFIGGRFPMEFGLGLTKNAGTGAFDHYLDSMDGIGYKIVMGNLYFLPMYGKYREGVLNDEDEIYQYFFQLQYENADTELEMGLMYDARVATRGGNDSVGGMYDPTSAGTIVGDFHSDIVGIYAQKHWGTLRLGFEANFHTGETGIENTDGDQIKINSFGMALELASEPENSAFHWSFMAGYMTGDDPETEDLYEGFLADRNYDIAMLMFNHPIGNVDATGSSSAYLNTASGLTKRHELPDVDYLTNAYYLAPEVRWVVSEDWSLYSKLIWANLVVSQDTDDDDVNLGTEVDLGTQFKPHKNLTWGIDVGLLFPGTLYEDKNFAYGIQTRAAISF